MVFYLDTSAIVKLVIDEPESEALEAWVASRADDLVSSDLVRTELLRGVRRVAPGRIERARAALDGMDLVVMRTALFERAAELDPPLLRSLDALHLACALDLGDELDGIVTYDERLAGGGRDHGVPVIAPV